MQAESTPSTLTVPEALRRAHAHWNAGQADQAELLCQRVLASWPGQADAHHLLGLMAHAYGNLDLAITHLNTACLAPRSPAIYVSNLAEMLRQKGRLAEAEVAARRAVGMDVSLIPAWTNLGIVLQESGKLEESLKILDWLVKAKPDWPEGHNNVGNTNRRLGHNDAAEAHYRKAVELKPDYAQAWCNLALLLVAKGRVDDAEKHARHAIDLNPQQAEAYLCLAEIDVARGDFGRVLSHLDALQNFAPQLQAASVARANTLRLVEASKEGARAAQGAAA